MITGFTADGLFPTFNTMDEVFGFSWSDDMGRMEKAKGSTGTVGITTDGAMNAIYGPYIQNLAYNKHNTLAVLGQKPYKTAYRFQEGLSMAANQSSGVVRGGYAPAPVYGDYIQFEMPYKVLAHRFAMNIGMAEIGEKGIDDVMTWQNQFDFEGDTWLYSINNDVLRPVESDPITGQGSAPAGSAQTGNEIVGLESIERIISNYTEGKSLKAGLNVPWKMTTDDSVKLPSTDSAQLMNKYRNPFYSGTKQAENNLNCYVDCNYDDEGDGSANVSHTNRQLTLPMIDNLFLACMPYWENNSTSGKVLVTGYDTLAKMQMILQPQQRYQGFVDAQFDVNGIKTVQGQNTGFQVATYNGSPLLPDMQVTKDGVSRIFLFDNEILHMGQLRAPTVELSENPIITGKYIRLCDMNQFGEVQCTGPFKGLGKVVHLKRLGKIMRGKPLYFSHPLETFLYHPYITSCMDDLLLTFEDWKPKKGFGAIYKYDFDNGMSYIGVTRYSVMSRYKNHLRADNIVDRALRTHKHSIKIISIVPEDELAEEEIRLIKEYNTQWPNGYNYSAGGEGNRMHPETKKLLSEMRAGEANPMWGKHPKRTEESMKPAREARKRQVRCVETGIIYNSLTEAHRMTEISLSHICSCCNGRRNVAGGFHWEYVDDPEIASFNSFARAYSRYINWEEYKESHKEELKQRGYELSQSNIGKKRKPYKKRA